MPLTTWGYTPQWTANSRFTGVYLATVKDTRDPTRMGRLKVWIPESNADFDDPQGWITVSYCSPFAGATDIDAVTRSPEQPENSQTSYGFWAVPPDIGNQVLIMFANGDASRGYWIGCVNQDRTHRMVPGIPAGNNFSDDENLLPVTEHNRKTDKKVTEDMQRAELSDGISAALKTQGLIRDHVRGLTHSGSRRETPSEVYGLLTPGPLRAKTQGRVPKPGERVTRMGGSQLVMDDAIGEEKIRLRTRSGAQILLDESNGMVYITNRLGTAWVQLDADGRIDVYGAETMSVRSERDFVVRADRDIVMEAGRNVSIKANRDWQENATGSQHAGETAGEGGMITLHANRDFDVIATEDLRLTVNGDGYVGVASDLHTVVGGSQFNQVEQHKHTVVNSGDWRTTVNSDISLTAGSNVELFAGNRLSAHSVSDTVVYAFGGKLDLGSQSDFSAKSISGDISIEAEDRNGNLAVKSNAGRNQMNFSNSDSEAKTELFSEGGITSRSAKSIGSQVYDGFGVDADGEVTRDGAPLGGGCFNIGGGINVTFEKGEALFDVPDDISMKLQNKVDRFGRPVTNSLEKINDGLDEVQERFNQLSNTVGEYLGDLWGVLDGLNRFPINLNLPFPTLPAFPQLPTFGLPALRLPEFDFDFCMNIGPLLTIGEFPQLPNQLFGNLRLDLNGWSKRNIKNWLGRQQNNFRVLASSLRVDQQVSVSINRGRENLVFAMRSLRNSLRNLSSVGITVQDKGTYVANYSTDLSSLVGALRQHQSDVATVPEVANQSMAEKILVGAITDSNPDRLDTPKALGEFLEANNLTESEADAFVQSMGGTDARTDFAISPSLSHLRGRTAASGTRSGRITTEDDVTYSEFLTEVISETESHLTAMDNITTVLQRDPDALDNTDFTELEPLADTLDQLVAELERAVSVPALPPEPVPGEPVPSTEASLETQHLAGFCTAALGTECTSTGLLTATIVNSAQLTPPFVYTWTRQSGAQVNGEDVIQLAGINKIFASVTTELAAPADAAGDNTVSVHYDLTVTDSSSPPVTLTAQLEPVDYLVFGVDRVGTLILSQTHSNYDGDGLNGVFSGGGGYTVGDTIELTNRDLVTVLAVDGAGSVTEFELTSVGGYAVADGGSGTAIAQQTVDPPGGTGFELTPQINNVTPAGA